MLSLLVTNNLSVCRLSVGVTLITQPRNTVSRHRDVLYTGDLHPPPSLSLSLAAREWNDGVV